jgi:hypothetical protein
MSTRGHKIEVVKIPREEEPASRPQAFPKMPRLYLELIENKAKIKQDLINKEYVHVEDTRTPPPAMEPTSPSSSIGSVRSPFDDDRSERDEDIQESKIKLVDSEDEDEDEDVIEVDKSPSSPVLTREENRSVDTDDLSKRLTSMLVDSDDEDEPKSVKRKRKDKYSRQRDQKGHSISKKTEAPSFAELAAAGSFVPRKELRDINNISVTEKQDEDSKRELLFKFELLRKSYPKASIPVYTVHTEYQTMINSYDDCVRRLSLDSSVESYKQYLIWAFMAVEFVFGKFLKLDMEGFAQQQIISMSSYEKLLIELGEKSYMPDGSAWSVEMRLLGLVLVNTAVFVGTKMLMNKTGVNLMNMMNGMSGNSNGSSDGTPKRKMKGPDVVLEDL